MYFSRLRRLTLLILAAACTSLFAAEYKPGEVYQSIKSKRQVRIGISKHYPPLNFNSGKRGVEIEMAKKLGEFLGAGVKLVPMNVSDYVRSIENGSVDIIIAGFSRNLARAKRIWFSDPYFTLTPGVMVRKGVLPQTKYGDEFEESPIKTIWDLRRVNRFKFAVKKGSSYEYILKKRMPDMPMVMVKTNDEGLKVLRDGKAYGFVHDSLYLQYLYRTSASFRTSYTLLTGGKLVEEICIGLPFGDTVLKNQINVFISELKREGLIFTWLKKYNKK